MISRKSRRLGLIDLLKDDLLLIANPDNISFYEMIFKDSRENGSLQLTKFGFELIKDRFDHWSVELSEKMSFANHTYLVNISDFPYYQDKKIITTFDSSLGVMMKMVSGDFTKLEKSLPRNENNN